MPEHQYVFIGGLHRSGTTLLGSVLAAHPEASGLTGTGVPEDEGQHLQDVFPTARAEGGPGNFAGRAHLTELSPSAAALARRRLLASWSGYWDLRKRVLIEKSPPNLVRLRALQSVFPNAAHVVIVRHPIAVTMATRKWTPNSPLDLVRHWVIAHDLLLADAAHVRRLTVVRYEDLVQAPGPLVSELFRLLGLQPVPVEFNVEAGLNEAYLARWRREGIDVSAAKDAHALEEAAKAFGYMLSGAGVVDPRDPRVRCLIPAG